MDGAASNGCICSLRVDGVDYYVGTSDRLTTGIPSRLNAAHLVYMTAGQYAEFCVYQDTVGSLNAQAGSQFSGFLVHS